MARVIQNEIKRPLADAILFGDLTGGGHVDIDAQGEDGDAKLVMTFSQTTADKKKKGKKGDKAPQPV